MIEIINIFYNGIVNFFQLLVNNAILKDFIVVVLSLIIVNIFIQLLSNLIIYAAHLFKKNIYRRR